jgi:hypothetical protein
LLSLAPEAIINSYLNDHGITDHYLELTDGLARSLIGETELARRAKNTRRMPGGGTSDQRAARTGRQHLGRNTGATEQLNLFSAAGKSRFVERVKADPRFSDHTKGRLRVLWDSITNRDTVAQAQALIDARGLDAAELWATDILQGSEGPTALHYKGVSPLPLQTGHTKGSVRALLQKPLTRGRVSEQGTQRGQSAHCFKSR